MVEKRMLLAVVAGFLLVVQAQAEAPIERRVNCQDSRQLISYTSAKFEDYKTFLDNNKISLVSPTYSARNLQEFVYEYKKFPENLRNQLIEAGATIHLVSGKSVMDDPAWSTSLKQTFDGRDQSTIAGAGGIPYVYKKSIPIFQKLITYCDLATSVDQDICKKNWRQTRPDEVPTVIVINRLYNGVDPKTNEWVKNHGSENLVLHEHAHALDSMYEMNGISNTAEFKLLVQDPKNREYLDVLGRDDAGKAYLKNDGEAFAELFAYYHACPESQQHMVRNAPALANFIEQLDPQSKMNLTVQGQMQAPASSGTTTP